MGDALRCKLTPLQGYCFFEIDIALFSAADLYWPRFYFER